MDFAMTRRVRFRTGRGVTYYLEAPGSWRRLANPGPPEAGFPPNFARGQLVDYEVVVGSPATLLCQPNWRDPTETATYITDSPVTEVW
jgi:hypothetical protein